MSWWKSKDKDILEPDSRLVIHVAPGVDYTLVSEDRNVEEASIKRIATEINKWALQDYTFDMSNSGYEHSLAYQLATIDLKFLPFQMDALRVPLMDNEYSRNASRFLDMLNYLFMTEPEWVFSLITGRFLYSQLYMMPRHMVITNDQEPVELPTKEDWAKCLSIYPWIPLLVFLQHDFDDAVMSVNTVTDDTKSTTSK